MVDLKSRPLVCVVTDRRRWRVPDEVAVARLEALTGAVAAAGLALVQVRERDMDARPLYDLVRRLAERTRDSATVVVVNDRADVAKATEGVGVHLRGTSAATERVRRWLPAARVVGRSVHSVEEALAAERAGVDYVCFGTVFPSASKGPAHPVAGLTGLRAVVEACTVPVLAIGGITPRTLAEVAGTGAAGFAAIGWFSGGDGSEQFEPARAIEQVLAGVARGKWR